MSSVRWSMTGFESLYLAKFALDFGTSAYSYNKRQQESYQSLYNANKQASINNQLSYNSLLHINTEQALELKKYAFDKDVIRRTTRREVAKQQAIHASMGGGFGKSGNSANATIRNIQRYAYMALARKDLNRDIRMQSFDQRRTNIQLNTASKNNVLFSNLSIGPSKTGAILEVLGSGIQNSILSQQGTK